jgi:cytochrome c oxidase cbb3-type subunit 3
MPAFGHDGVLARSDLESVAAYVQSLSNPAAVDVLPDQVAAGKAVFAANCAACHGEGGQGNTELGAPNLADQAWIYGGDLQSIYTTVWGGRQGHMPTWEGRLSALDRKILALYLVDLRGPTR